MIIENKKRLIINYIIKKKISSFNELLMILRSLKPSIIVAKASVARILHNLAIPKYGTVLLPKDARSEIVKIGDITVLRDFADRVSEALDVFIPVAKNRDYRDLVFRNFDKIYCHPLTNKDEIHPDALSVLEQLNAFDKLLVKDVIKLFITFNRDTPQVVKKELLKRLPPQYMNIATISIMEGVQRVVLPLVPSITSFFLRKKEEKRVEKKVVPFLTIIKKFLRNNRITHLRKAEKEIALQFLNYGYKMSWIENGAFVLLTSEGAIPNNIIIQVAKRKFPTKGLLKYLRDKYSLKGSYVGVFICTGYVSELIHKKFFPNWYTFYYHPTRGWQLHTKAKSS